MWSPPIWNNFSVQDNSINANIHPFFSLWISWLKESHVMSTGLFLNIAPLSAACVCVCACVLHMPLEFLTSFLRRETGRFLYIWFQFFQSWSIRCHVLCNFSFWRMLKLRWSIAPPLNTIVLGLCASTHFSVKGVCVCVSFLAKPGQCFSNFSFEVPLMWSRGTPHTPRQLGT